MITSGNKWKLAWSLALAGCAGAEEGGLELELATTTQELGTDFGVSEDMLARRWPNGVVPYDIVEVAPSSVPPPLDERPMEREAWRRATGGAVRFVLREGSETPYMHAIINDDDNKTKGKRGVSSAVN